MTKVDKLVAAVAAFGASLFVVSIGTFVALHFGFLATGVFVGAALVAGALLSDWLISRRGDE